MSRISQEYDLPCKLVIVMGHNSGGTSATTGTLVKNGFYGTDKTATDLNFEDPTIRDIFSDSSKNRQRISYFNPDIWRLYAVPTYCRWLKKQALENGYDKAVVKYNGFVMNYDHIGDLNYPLWSYLVTALESGMNITPLLLHRDPISTTNSWIKRRERNGQPTILFENTIQNTIKIQNNILWLHETYGWPMWEFGKNADISELEKLVGEPLPIKYYTPDRVKY